MKPQAWSVVIGLVAAGVLLALAYTGVGPGLFTRAPHQPIAFYHYVHARDRQIACDYCHRTVYQAAFAGMPSTHFCMRCHRAVIPQYAEIRKLYAYYDHRQAVPWARVNLLPGFVAFNHQAHTVTGKLPCGNCHGSVKNQAVLHQAAPMKMGWCLKCHRRKGAPTYCWVCHR